MPAPAPRARVLILGVSTRAMAQSAVRAGFRVICVDAFGDLDLPAGARSIALPRDLGVPYGAKAAMNASRDIDCDAVAYVADLENHPAAVCALATGRALWGNPPEWRGFTSQCVADGRAPRARTAAVGKPRRSSARVSRSGSRTRTRTSGGFPHSARPVASAHTAAGWFSRSATYATASQSTSREACTAAFAP